MGELVAAVVELKDDKQYTQKELLSLCSDLPTYQRPRKFIFQKVLRNHMGKIDKKKMVRLYS